MKFSIPQLQKYKKAPLVVNEDIDIKDVALARFSDRLADISKLHLEGEINYKANDRVKVDLNVSGSAKIFSSIYLNPTDYLINFKIDELYVQDEVTLNTFSLTDQVFLIEDNQIDIDEIVLENVIVDLPIAIEDEVINNKGEGWEIIDENDYQEKETSENKPTQTLGDFFPDNQDNKKKD